MRYERFRQRVVRDAAGAHWCDDDDFDIHHHVVREKLARNAARASAPRCRSASARWRASRSIRTGRCGSST